MPEFSKQQQHNKMIKVVNNHIGAYSKAKQCLHKCFVTSSHEETVAMAMYLNLDLISELLQIAN